MSSEKYKNPRNKLQRNFESYNNINYNVAEEKKISQKFAPI